MSVRSVSTSDDGMPPAEVRELDAEEVRVLGALLEKQQTTPEYYPLTMNALLAACNQKSNREPVMEMSEDTLHAVVERLRDERLVREVSGSRASRFEHLLDYRLRINRAERALLTVMMLRGPQTLNELRTRTERMHPFAAADEIEALLDAMSQRTRPMAVRLPRRPGQKEERWTHTLASSAHDPTAAETTAPTPRTPLAERVAELEQRLGRVEATLRELAARLGVGE